MDSESSITTWQQAFEEHRIPTTRTIEKQLRSSATRDRDKLRTLVGGSYRELLATAESIVVLDSKIKGAEEHLSTIGRDCRPPQQDTLPKSPPSDKVALAQSRLLQRSCTTLATALRQQRILQCAQLLVVSRLLIKSLGEHESRTRNLDFLKNKISLLRRQLLRQVDAKFLNPTSPLADLVEAICSYCLVTSVSSDDALAHVRQLRFDKMRRQLSQPSHDATTICEALRYQLASLQTFKALVGRPLAEAMTTLQKRPILEDHALRSLESLDLDRTLSLIPTDIQTFVPYFKRSSPSPQESRLKLETWSAEAFQVLISALGSHLSEVSDIPSVLELRKELYATLLPSYFSTPGSSDMHDQVRLSLNKRLRDLCQEQVTQLVDITTLMIKGTAATATVKPLWDPDVVPSGVNKPSSQFIQQIKDRHTGHNGALKKATKSLRSWVSLTRAIQSSFDELTKIRWRDLLEEPEEEDEDDALEIVKKLGQTDPASYGSLLRGSLRESLSMVETSIDNAVAQAGTTTEDIGQVVALLRCIRVAVATLQDAFPGYTTFDKIAKTVPHLHDLVAGDVVSRLSRSVERKRKSSSLKSEGLLEDMPSPKAFSTLRRLCEIMFDVGGTDLWSNPAVGKVKDAIRARIFMSEYKASYMVNDFDEAYLRAALKSSTGSTEEVSQAVEGNMRGGREYWTRTKLLFGPLA